LSLLEDGSVLGHPWVTGELALGHLSHRSEILGLLHNLPQAQVATDAEVLTLIDDRQLFGLGIGYVDAHLLAATMLTTGARLWTHDKRLTAVADQLDLVRDNEAEP
jgi:predicted nucleic acid-binding protein